MSNRPVISEHMPEPAKPLNKPGRVMPGTKTGKWSVGLAVTFLILFIINQAVFMNLPEDVPWRPTLLPFYGIGMMACGLASGITALIAVIRDHERSWLVYLPLFFGGFVVFFLLGEFLFPH